MFPDFGIVLDKLQLVGQLSRILLGNVEEPGASSADQLNKQSGSLLASCHALDL